MAVIPRRIYNAVEKQLRERRNLLANASLRLTSVCDAAYSPSTSRIDEAGGSHSGGTYSDRTQQGALAVDQARESFGVAIDWWGVFERLDLIFAGRPEAEMAALYYDEGLSAKDVAEHFGIDRQTVRNYRDTYVTHCALLAAEKGLVTMSQETEEWNHGAGPVRCVR